MAVATKTAVLCRNAMLNALYTYAGDAGKLVIYKTDRAIPASVDTALDGGHEVALATFTLNATAFGAASVGVLTAGTIADVVAAASGTAAFFRVWKANGTTAIWQGTVDTASADLILNSVAIVSGATISISALTYTLGE
jgi:hypothetical protein